MGMPQSLVELIAEKDFSGVVRADRGEELLWAQAYGSADRRHAMANTVDTRFAIASGVKGFTALATMSVIAAGQLDLATPVRSVLGADLPLIDDAVTVEQLLAHRSGIGDYFDEDDEDLDIDDYVLPISVHRLDSTEAYLQVLDGYPQKFPPGERFAYCNGGFVVLALVAERASGVPFPDLVRTRVCEPAGMVDTAFLRSDALPGRTAIGYLADGVRSNVFHLPVQGSGDGGAYSTAADIASFWRALFAGRILPTEVVAEMTRPHSVAPEENARYGLGFWLDETGPGVELRGFDAGVSFWSLHDPTTGLTQTTISNTSAGAWPIARRQRELLG